MSRPLLYDLWPTVMERMDLANRIQLSLKCPALRRTDQRCPAKANTVEIATNGVKINNTSFYVEKYESESDTKHIEILKDDGDTKTVVLKTTVPLLEAREKLFETIMKRRSGIVKVKNLSIIGDLNCVPPNLKLCVQNFKIAKPDTNFLEAFSEKRKRTRNLIVDLQKVLTADSFPLESLEMDYNFAVISNIPATTVITTRQQFGMQAVDIHRIHVKNCVSDWLDARDLVERWQISKPEIGRHWSLEGCSKVVSKIFVAAAYAPGARRYFTCKRISAYDLIFPIDEEKVLNVFTEVVEKEHGMDEYVVHFKVVPKL
ncbi:hypothetical protein B9Z55_009063 [Caenorhabditis nigoni]|uniref:DUF38 domain-containing protein n=1 Tax=Caenorhabditis nigoni TaxID=1611254 RepID=A0A2G5UR98_9PELO|nr:hypothetical protein B9Z55_009063 [Caenorhabditis nigoni]